MTQIAIRGNLTAPVELRYTQSGKAVGNVTVAVNRKRGDQEETDFYRVTLWESLAENASTLEKGTSVVVVGRIESREYESRDGGKRTVWEVTADAFGPDLRFQAVTVSRAGGRGQDARSQSQVPTGAGWDASGAQNGFGDDTPF